MADYDLDGIDEVALGTPGQTVVVDVAEGAGIGSWDLRASRVALASVLRRRPEPYHDQIREGRHEPVESWRSCAIALPTQTSPRISALLIYDDHERRSALVRVLDQDGVELGAFDTGAWQVERVADSRLVAQSQPHGA